jgi:transposase, IS5 family
MTQVTFAEAEYANKKRKTRRELFLERMDGLIPWAKLEQKLSRHYAKPGKLGGWPPYPLSTMLRVHCLQLLYNLRDPAMEEALYEIESMRRFAGLHLDRIPDETTILNFRHLLEKKNLVKKLFETINQHLAEQGLSFKEGIIMDATIISAPTSTKNADNARDPEMHQTRKGNQRYFGLKAHIGTDETQGLIHSLENTSDINVADKLLHGQENPVWGDAGYRGIEKRDEHVSRDVDWQIALRPSARAALPNNSPLATVEKIKASMRPKVEHAFRYMKQVFGYTKMRYRGLAKNANYSGPQNPDHRPAIV